MMVSLQSPETDAFDGAPNSSTEISKVDPDLLTEDYENKNEAHETQKRVKNPLLKQLGEQALSKTRKFSYKGKHRSGRSLWVLRKRPEQKYATDETEPQINNEHRPSTAEIAETVNTTGIVSKEQEHRQAMIDIALDQFEERHKDRLGNFSSREMDPNIYQPHSNEEVPENNSESSRNEYKGRRRKKRR